MWKHSQVHTNQPFWIKLVPGFENKLYISSKGKDLTACKVIFLTSNIRLRAYNFKFASMDESCVHCYKVTEKKLYSNILIDGFKKGQKNSLIDGLLYSSSFTCFNNCL